jgi:hypothetical protein
MNKRTHIFKDIPGTRECDYKTECAIRCKNAMKKSEYGSKKTYENITTGSGSDEEIQVEIQRIMIEKTITTLPDLIISIKEQIPGVKTHNITRNLTKMIYEKTRILRDDGGISILEHRKIGSNEVISLSPSEITDSFSPYHQRMLRIPRKPVGFWGIDKAEVKETEEVTVNYDELYKKYINNLKIMWNNITNKKDFKYKTIKELINIPNRKINNEIIANILYLFKENLSNIDDIHWIGTLAENMTIYVADKGVSYPYMADPKIRKELLIRLAKYKESDEKDEITDLLCDAYIKTSEIREPGIRSPDYEIITPTEDGNIERISTKGSSRIIPLGKKLVKLGLHSFRYTQASASTISRDLPKSILRFFVEDYIEDLKARGAMCGGVHPARFKTMINNYFMKYMNENHKDIIFSEELNENIKPIFLRKQLMTCMILEAITRQLKTYRPPHISKAEKKE